MAHRSRSGVSEPEWIYFIHPPRSNFADTMTPQEKAAWSVQFDRFQRLLKEGVVILVGPTLGKTNTGIAIFEAPDEDAARRFMEEDPVVAGGFARGATAVSGLAAPRPRRAMMRTS